MTDGRKRTAIIAASIAAAGTLAITSATPASAEPNIDDVREKVDTLYQKAEQASERYNDAKLALKNAQVRLDALQADVAEQKKTVNGMRSDVAQVVVSQYQGQALSAASQVVFSSDSKEFVDNLNAMTAYNSQRGQVVSDYRVQLDRLQLREDAAADQVASLDKIESKMADEKAKIDQEAGKAKELLSTLEAEEREKLDAADSSAAPAAPSVNVPVSGRAGAAIKYAMAQVGDAYVWGAEGPNAFDCSGLMLAAWAQAGVSLPHSSSAQMSSGARVAESDLKPGDLVFYYSPVSHVGMYIGNGQIVHAANPRTGVQVTSLHSMPYVGAVRPG